jgi:hypothetical protein
MTLNPSDAENDLHARGDLLVGRAAIHAYLVLLGMPEDTDVYYLRRSKRWPIGNTGGDAGGGGKLIASKKRLARYADEVARGRARTDQVKLQSE